MKVLSVNVGLPRHTCSGRVAVMSGIYKAPIHRRVRVNRLNLEGDAQADLSVHGGANKAVYAYPSEHYDFWRRELPNMDLSWGMFGENLTLEGLIERDAHIGEHFRIGTAILMVTQPRLPCYKLGIRFGRDDMPERFLASRRTGFYFAVIEEGDLGEGDIVEEVGQESNRVSIADIVHLHLDNDQQNNDLIERALKVEALPSGWRKGFLKKLQESNA